LIFNVNQLPYDVEHTEGFFRRFIIMPFNVKIPKDKRDIHLAKKIIRDELPGVFNWALKGLHRLLKQKDFTHSEKIENEVKSYRTESDSVALFMDDAGFEESLESYKTQKELYGAYRSFAIDSGFKPVSNITFGKRLDHIGFIRETKSEGKVVYVKKSSNQPF
jgi:putative DNA primase/helicase